MTKSNRLSILIATCLVFLLSPLFSMAQEMTVQAPKSVYVGDNFTVRFIINEKASDFKGPTFKGFSLRGGPSTSSSSSTSFVNGQMSHSVSTTFSYTLLADMEGTFTIGPASCTANGKKISSQSFTIQVEKLSAAQQQQRQQQQQQRGYDPWGRPQQQSQQPVKIDDKSLFARASVSNSHPYQGEQVIITYKIYTQVPISQFAIDKLPGNRGFWAEDLSEGKQIKQYEETIGDRRYQVAEIRRGALFAQQSGKLTIDPLDLNVLAIVQQQRQRTGSIMDLFDDAFFNTRQAVERSLSTNRISIDVRSLPTAPQDYSGAVGKFEVKGGINTDKVRANEAITYRLTVSGTGNLTLINAPQPTFPSVFEVYDPQIMDNIQKSDNGISGTRTFEWILIPRTKGEYRIPEFRFVYFDPTTGQYVTRTVAAQDIKVERGDPNNSVVSGKDDVQLLNNDINYIHPVTKLRPIQDKEQAGAPFWIVFSLIFIIVGVIIIVGNRAAKAEQDVAGMRMRRATRMAQKRLKKAAQYLNSNDTDAFYQEIYRAIWGCLSDKYTIPLSQLNRDTVSECLAEKQVPQAQQESIMKVLQDVDLARFAPGDPQAQKKSIYSEALVMIAGL